MRIPLLLITAFLLSACSGVDPNPSCATTCHNSYPAGSRELLDCVSECSSLGATTTGDR